MPYEELIRQGRIRLHPASRREIENLLDLAARDLRASQANLDIAPEWAYAMAYNAILQAGRALMFSLGFRPRESEGHRTVVNFLREAVGPQYAARVEQLDQMRRKRHPTLYETAGVVGGREAEQSLAFAQEFVDALHRLVRADPRQGP